MRQNVGWHKTTVRGRSNSYLVGCGNISTAPAGKSSSASFLDIVEEMSRAKLCIGWL